MATFYYVKGEPVTNAQAYELWKGTTKTENGKEVFVPSGDAPLETQQILQQLQIVGSIGDNGNPAEEELVTNENVVKNIAPITKLTENGYVYYVRVTGFLNVKTSMSSFSGVPFQGTVYFNTPSAVDFKVTGLEYSAKDKAIQVKTNYGNANVYNVDFGDAIISQLLIDNGTIRFYSANTASRRTDFIPITELTDHLRIPGENNYACVGPFGNGVNAIGGYKIAFYTGMSHSTFIKGLRWEDFQEAYLNAEYIQGLVEEYAPNAKYVIFSSSPTNHSTYGDNDFVSLGGIHFLLTGSDKFTDGEAVKLAVKAKGDGTFFSDSPFSNAEPYTHTTT
ncbi:MAG: hypothetical protein IKW46_08230 [Bacteroidaceae bacterium]|nr:hypothetical protein [Bacteroidaceae bacterium]